MSIDPIWEQKYEAGHSQKYPWDAVVSFVFRQARRIGKPENIHIVEVGCGTGSNLWFAAREGFKVAGIDGSSSAINALRQRFVEECLHGDFHVGGFDQLPFGDSQFDIVIDRAGLTCANRSELPAIIDEVSRVMKPGGYFMFTPYADSHSSYSSGTRLPDGTITNIRKGTLMNVGQISFASRSDIDALFPPSKWVLQSVVRKEHIDMLNVEQHIHAEWQVVAQKI
jgi:ubiquinone/menaquinone biosynthesis C-methylase UbiE